MRRPKKDYIWNHDTCSCQNGEYLASIINDSVIMCDEITKDTKGLQENFNEKRLPGKQKMSILYLPLYRLH